MHLEKLTSFRGCRGPLLLIVMDGIGVGEEADNNAVWLARTPVLDGLLALPLRVDLRAKGPAVGMPSEDDMGNSEVGHNAIGAGRVFDQGAKLVAHAIEDGTIFAGELWRSIVQRGRDGHSVHLIGLLSDGKVHSHIDHLFALVRCCAASGVGRLRVHALLDGRDVGERSALGYLDATEALLAQLSRDAGVDYRIASGGGRMKVTMDRYEADWSVVKRGWDAHVRGLGRAFESASAAVRTFYEEDPQATDQYLDPFVVAENGDEPVGRIADGDAVIFFNFRGDRAIEISRAFEEKDFSAFDRVVVPDVLYAGMLEYDGDRKIPKNYLVDPPAIDRTLSEYLCMEGIHSFAISETQKFGHVTYFWNGNRSGYIDESLETYIEIPSDRIEFDKAPAMKAAEITHRTIELLRSGTYRFGRLNFANGDMVGHTGVMEAVVAAVEAMDACLGRLLEAVEKLGGIAVVTADHGNAEEMFSIVKGERVTKTSHSLNLVPFVIFHPEYAGEYEMAALQEPGLANIAATLCNLLGFDKPDDYAPSLITFK